MTIQEMYNEAASECTDYEGGYFYAGYTAANALSFYVDEKYGVNAADSTEALNCLQSVL